jgi:hypothetical protein
LADSFGFSHPRCDWVLVVETKATAMINDEHGDYGGPLTPSPLKVLLTVLAIVAALVVGFVVVAIFFGFLMRITGSGG